MTETAKTKRKGATLTGYGLVVGLIAVVGIGAITAIGTEVSGLFGDVASELDGVASGATGGGSAPSSDDTPDSFDFVDITGQVPSALVESNIVQISGIDTAVTVTVSGGGSPEFRICADSGCSSVLQAYGSSAQSLNSGEYVQMRVTSAASSGGSVTANVSVGQGSADWQVGTGASVTFSQAFTAGSNVTEPQCTAWQNWVPANISAGNTYNFITLRGGGDPIGRTCTGPDANTLCQALLTNTQTTNIFCDGYRWQVWPCGGNRPAIQAETTTVQSACQCPASNEGPFYVMRPCHPNFGGINDANSCTSVSQTFELVCGY